MFPNLFENRQAVACLFLFVKKNRINQTMFGKLTSIREVLSMKMTKDIYGKMAKQASPPSTFVKIL